MLQARQQQPRRRRRRDPFRTKAATSSPRWPARPMRPEITRLSPRAGQGVTGSRLAFCICNLVVSGIGAPGPQRETCSFASAVARRLYGWRRPRGRFARRPVTAAFKVGRRLYRGTFASRGSDSPDRRCPSSSERHVGRARVCWLPSGGNRRAGHELSDHRHNRVRFHRMLLARELAQGRVRQHIRQRTRRVHEAWVGL